MIVITTPTGQIGHQILDQILDSGKPIRVIVRDPSRLDLKIRNRVEVVQDVLVNLDVPEIDVYFIGEPDPHISSIAARGSGQIGTIGVSAAIANAVFNATGKRIRELPLILDKLL